MQSITLQLPVATQWNAKLQSCNLIGLPKNKIAELAKTKKTLNCHQTLSLTEGGVWGRDYVLKRFLILSGPTEFVLMDDIGEELEVGR